MSCTERRHVVSFGVLRYVFLWGYICVVILGLCPLGSTLLSLCTGIQDGGQRGPHESGTRRTRGCCRQGRPRGMQTKLNRSSQTNERGNCPERPPSKQYCTPPPPPTPTTACGGKTVAVRVAAAVAAPRARRPPAPLPRPGPLRRRAPTPSGPPSPAANCACRRQKR